MTEPRQTQRLSADEPGIAAAAELLRAGKLVALPTETVYGLAADASNDRAVAAIYAAKERPSFNPLISHLPDVEAARRQGLFDAPALALAKAFWPGPLTLVVPASSSCTVCSLARAGLDSVALRVPSDPVARAVLQAAGRPIAAPSANRSGRVSPTQAEHVLADLDGRIDAVLDAGPTAVGVESSIVACLGGVPRLLRPGGVPRAALEAVIGQALVIVEEGGTAPIAPGLLASHYAPHAAVRLDAEAPRPGEAWLGFGAEPNGALPALAFNLSPAGDLTEAAANLFAAMRQLDDQRPATIAVAPIPMHGLGEAINDRLRRAAAPR
ncbi:L-threonylcarbamoyladenylate synthase [Bosea sp. (in: a-proteobacteria)]|uniref:L-threonylcarbamoyladenylate synthase n=1 Tax=Bosea sp. (in: a-proteobacteria) TaxID=1871050 RepID=UPI001DF5616D|nr:L-threonylcarbamoyladenylate synthase [Bosea sp. (in: a-proteobacteria)]MBA4223251.1 threonylcarbamoyl-AMP synthase [Methylobacterium sp.]MBR3189894.1 threonylcarbamoyl-AMP synthase [Bosea sp. (in: a-proteobacteria)]